MPTVERSKLHVEGTDDVHVVKHLLLRHGIDCPTKRENRPQHEFDPNVPEISAAGDKDAVLAAIGTAVPVSNGRSVGFVLDADEEPQDRWSAVCGRLRVFGLDLPDEIPPEGFVDDVAEFGACVGVWLMPDNQREGALERFLEDLVDDNDPCSLLLKPRRQTLWQRARGFQRASTEKPFCIRGLRGKKIPACLTGRLSTQSFSASTALSPWLSLGGTGASSRSD